MFYERLAAAVEIAAERYAGVVDKSGVPIICHAVEVSNAAHEYCVEAGAGNPEDYAIVGMLHDAYEDAPYNEGDMMRLVEFGEEIFEAVMAMTRGPEEDYETYLAGVAECPMALAVKMVDIENNAGRLHMIEDPATAARLTAKYKHAIAVLGG